MNKTDIEEKERMHEAGKREREESSHGALSAEIVRLRQDKADLLAALKNMVAAFGGSLLEAGHTVPANIDAARAAIARAERP